MPEFFDRYIKLVDESISLLRGLAETQEAFSDLEDELVEVQDYRYQPEKWTPRDMLQHVIDNERIQSYRALAIARGEKVTLPGYNENSYAANTTANNRNLDELLDEFNVVRHSTILLFDSFSEKQMLIEGICFEIKVTPLALGFQIIGHQLHHLNVLKERYLNLIA